VVSHLFPAADIGMRVSSFAAAVFIGAVVMRAETKTALATMTTTTMNETCRGTTTHTHATIT